jgi:RNA cap guanine-N2 methyltransferase
MSALRTHHVRVYPLPAWLDVGRLLGPGFTLEAAVGGTLQAQAQLDRSEAADLQARLRGMGLDGAKLCCEVTPPLHRPDVRKARLHDARRRRAGTPGFLRQDTQLDPEGRVSLTPEPLAVELAAGSAGLRVIDAGCGAGGNAIAFARAGAQVTAIERDATRLRMAQHNARVYGVADRIDWREGDALELVPGLSGDVLFVDPPWGTEWDRAGTTLAQLPLLAALLPVSRHLPRVWLKLPPSFDTRCVPGARARAVFGAGEGDRQRIKFVWLTLER